MSRKEDIRSAFIDGYLSGRADDAPNGLFASLLARAEAAADRHLRSLAGQYPTPPQESTPASVPTYQADGS